MSTWIIAASSRVYDHEAAFGARGFIDWRQVRKGTQVGDIVYIYNDKSSDPPSRLRYKTVVKKVNMSPDEIVDDKEYWLDLDEYENTKTHDEYIRLIEETKEFRDYIGGVHLWGKSITDSGRKVSHCGDLNTYFADNEIKKDFLCAFNECFGDGVFRKMVLEVNSGNNDLLSIVNDLIGAGIKFV